MLIPLHKCSYIVIHTVPLPHSCTSNRLPNSKVAGFPALYMRATALCSDTPLFLPSTAYTLPCNINVALYACLLWVATKCLCIICKAVGWATKANKWGSTASIYLTAYKHIHMYNALCVCVCVLVVECTCWKAVPVFVCGNNEAVCWHVHTYSIYYRKKWQVFS